MITKHTDSDAAMAGAIASRHLDRTRFQVTVPQAVEKVDFTIFFIGFLLLHAPLALVMERYPYVAAGHAIIVFIIGLLLAFRSSTDSPYIGYVIGYMVGAEVLWRATDVAYLLSSEQVRYVSFLLILIVSLRNRRQTIPFFPLLHLLFLLPSLINYVNRDLVFLRFWAVSALIGPIATTLMSFYFYGRSFDKKALVNLALFTIAPIIGSAAIVLYNGATLDIQFGTGSNELVAGYGANQVSNVLAMGAVFCWLLIVQPSIKGFHRLVLIALFAAISIPMLLTFSRSGAWTVGIVIVATSLLLIIASPVRSRIFFVFILLIATVFIWLVPWLNDLTSGMFIRRFTDTNASGREELAQSELAIWRENPIFGIGPGMARERVDDYYSRTELQTHVEYTRVLAEHGLFGGAAVVILLLGAFHNFRRAENWAARVWIAGAVLYMLAYIGNSAYRTAAPSFMYGLIWANLFVEKAQDTLNAGKR